jgi:hypothetical protein
MRFPGLVATGLLLAACARTSATVTDRQGSDSVPLPACGAPKTGSQRLESYLDVRIPGSYWVDMVFEGGEWAPAERIPMPHHHATRLELTNLGDFALSAHQARRLRFTLEITSREINQVPGRRQWRAVYSARVLEVCLP